MPAKVSIIRSRSLTDEAAVKQAVAEAVSLVCDLREVISPGQTVVLKPNVFAPQPPPITTDPRVVVAVGELARAAGAGRVIVAEGRSISTAKYRASNNSTRACCEVTGMAQAVAAAGFELVCLEEDEFLTVDMPEAQILKQARVPRTIMEADVFINMPVMKIHSLAVITMAVKNLHGIISDYDKLFTHNYREAALARKLTDLLRIRHIDLNVLDGLMAQEADHATEGIPVEMGLILASRDAVALDAVAGAVAGLTLEDVDTTRIAGEAGLGEADLSRIEVLGETIAAVRRPFLKPDIALSEAKFPGLRICGGDYCRSCSYYIRRGLDKLAAEGRLDPARPLSIIVGREPVAPESIDGPVLILGDCAMASASVKPLRDRLLLEGRLHAVYACPPMSFRMQALQLLD
jgi:uncharacterized protein (DUF362 family)